MIINLDAQIEKMKDIEDARAILRQMIAAVNKIYDSRNIFDSDIEITEGHGIKMKRQGSGALSGDGKQVRFIASGVGTSTATFEE